jgi:alpha-tubulin suppressor-like RCC1 family protein
MTTKILGTQIEGTIQTQQLANNVTATFATTAEISEYATTAGLAQFASALAPKVTTVNVANSAFTVLDDTAVNTGGGYIVVTGENFQNGATVLIDTTSATSVSRINSTTLRVQVPARPAASYNLFVVNPDGGTGIRVSGITYSANPNWVTASPLSNQANNTAFAITLSATEATSYALAAGSSLPAGTTLLANGYFFGTVTVGVQTVYSFDVVATDAQLQDSSKTFGLTVTVAPPRRLYAWGLNSSGQLGLNYISPNSTSSPVQIGTGTDWSIVSGGSWSYSAAIKANGTLWSWGSNGFGELGHNDTIPKSSPVQIGADTNWAKLSVKQGYTMAIKTNGTLWAWGWSSQTGLGLNQAANRSSPTQVGSLTNWSSLSSGINSVFSIKTDGTLWSWGYNAFGILGSNNIITRSSPVQVGADANWSSADNDEYAVAVIKTTGTLFTWGYGDQGNLGNSTRINRSSPVQVGADANWSKVAVINQCMLAIKTTGTLWSWGYNSQGQLGNNSTTPRSSPVQVGALTNWSQIDGQNQSVIATKTDGTLWTWGENNAGQLGINTGNPNHRSSPVQVGGSTNWSYPSGGSSFGLAITSG